jgi:elongation factor G
VGPYLSGKTTLLEAILFRTGAIQRQGRVSEKSTVGDAAPEAREHGMSVELNAATTKYLGDSYTFLDCPGSIEFAQDQRAALAGADVAIVVCEADDKKAAALQLILKQLDEIGLPRRWTRANLPRATCWNGSSPHPRSRSSCGNCRS